MVPNGPAIPDNDYENYSGKDIETVALQDVCDSCLHSLAIRIVNLMGPSTIIDGQGENKTTAHRSSVWPIN